MSPSGRTEHVVLLRDAIARIEAGLPVRTSAPPPVPMPAPAARGTGRRVVPLGPEGFGLDRMLGGGLRTGALHEVVPHSGRDEAAASGFALAVAARCIEPGGMLIWIVEDCAAGESGLPYRPGLQAHGLDPDRLVVVRTKGADATLWAAEEALRAGDFVVLAELWGGRHYGLAPSRRLVLAARSRGGTGLLLHAGLGQDHDVSSGSETRFAVAGHPSSPRAAFGGPLPVPGDAAFGVRVAKLRNAAAAGFDHDHSFPLIWNAEQRCFHDHDLSVALASHPADGPAQANRPGGQTRGSNGRRAG